MQSFLLLLTILVLFDRTWGHGMMVDPAGRSSRWRFNSTAPINYDDDGLYCGGLTVHFEINGGKCGICGDDYRDPMPRDNELGGLYGQGVIVKTYRRSNPIKMKFVLTTNHLGYVYMDLCNLDKAGKESEDCFEHRLKFISGSDKFYVGDTEGEIHAVVVLPQDIKCKHCILRWTYRAGNNWNLCGDDEDDDEGALGCGDQETFKSCADISII